MMVSENSRTGSRTRLLEEEGDVAADYLEELLDIADFDGDIEIDVENDRASVAIVSEDPNSSLGRLVGDEGEVLEALQELTRLAVQASTGERSRLMLDIDGFRAGRKAELLVIAGRACEKVKQTGNAVDLEPMNPFERKVCHDAVAAAGLVSESEGTEPNRYVVIHPAEESEAVEVSRDGVTTVPGQGADEVIRPSVDDVEAVDQEDI